MKIKTLCYITLFLSIPLTWATTNRTIYKTILPSGEVLYSGSSEPGSEQIKLNITPFGTKGTATPNNASVPTNDMDLNAVDKIPMQYQVRFNTPKNEQLFGVGEPNIPISLDIKPALHATDRIQLFFDNKAYGILQSDLEYTLSNLDRGTHTLQAKVFSNKQSGESKGETGVISIHIFKPSVLNHGA